MDKDFLDLEKRLRNPIWQKTMPESISVNDVNIDHSKVGLIMKMLHSRNILASYFRKMESAYINNQNIVDLIKAKPHIYEEGEVSLYTDAQESTFMSVFWYGSVILDIGQNQIWKETEKDATEEEKLMYTRFCEKFSIQIHIFSSVRDFFTHPFKDDPKKKNRFKEKLGHSMNGGVLESIFFLDEKHSMNKEYNINLGGIIGTEINLNKQVTTFRIMLNDFLDITDEVITRTISEIFYKK